MPVTYTKTPEKYIKELKKRHGGLAIASSNTVNQAGKFLERKYKQELRKFTLRNRFTTGAVQLLKSKAKSSKGGFRQVKDINAVVGVKKMRGGKEHYLLDQEQGGIHTGSRKTMGFVAVPTDAARQSESHRKPISGPLRLQNTGEVQVLKIGGENLGYNDRFNKKGGKQRWAILYKYKNKNTYGWDLKKQFLFESLKSGLGVFKKKGKNFKKIRDLEQKTIIIKARHKFDKSFDKVTPNFITGIFKRESKKFLGK